MSWNEVLSTLIAIFVIVDPIGTIPLYLSFTENIKSQRSQVAQTAAVALGIILCISLIAGEFILNFFHISIDAFRVAGGVLLISMAFDMLHADKGRVQHTPEEDKEAIDSKEVAIIPLAMPLLAGPGAMSSVILLGNQVEGFMGKATLASICLFVAGLTWVIFRFAPQLDARLSKTNINIAMRIMGLVLIAIAVEFIVAGLRNLMPGLSG